MIVYDLHCANGHVFEEWFSGAGEYEDKVAGGDLACPQCGDTEVKKALSAPRVNGGAARPVETPCGLPACAAGGCQMMNGG
jgi:hypothetical protein